MNLYQILIKPLVTEKSTQENATGKYTFVVDSKANKIEITQAIQALYGIKVTKVTVRQTPEKTRIVGRGKVITKRDAVKKATVTVEKGKTLDVYKFSKK